MKDKHVCVTHVSDLDGVASGILLYHHIWNKFRQKPEILFADYDNVGDVLDEALKNATHLWVADLSIRNLELVEKLSKFTPETFHFYDHHVDSAPFVKAIEDIATIHFDSSGDFCAADLIWKDFLQYHLTTSGLLRQISDDSMMHLHFLTKATHSRDLWINDVSEGASLTDVIAMLGAKKAYEHLMEDLSRVREEKYSDLMKFCTQMSEDKMNVAKNLAQKSMVSWYHVLPDNDTPVSVIAALTSGCQSDVGHFLLNQTPHSIVGLINTEALSISFRTTEDVVTDLGFGVNTIAKTIGGGGHTYAAGAPLSNEILIKGPKALLDIMLIALKEENTK